MTGPGRVRRVHGEVQTEKGASDGAVERPVWKQIGMWIKHADKRIVRPILEVTSVAFTVGAGKVA